MTKSSQNQQWILTAVRMAEIFLKKQFQSWQIHSAVWNKKAHDPTRRTKCIFTALQNDAHLYSWLPKLQDFGRAHIFRAHTLYTGREKQGKKKVKAWVREINEELIYRECSNPPQQSREKQGRIAAPLESGKDTREHKQPPPLWQTLLWHGNGGEHGSGSTATAEGLDRSFAPCTACAHQTQTLHDQKDVRDRTIVRLLPFNHSFTGDSSQSTLSLSSITPCPCVYLYPYHKEIHSCD